MAVVGASGVLVGGGRGRRSSCLGGEGEVEQCGGLRFVSAPLIRFSFVAFDFDLGLRLCRLWAVGRDGLGFLCAQQYRASYRVRIWAESSSHKYFILFLY
jgi:hypothetical protein